MERRGRASRGRKDLLRDGAGGMFREEQLSRRAVVANGA